MITHHWCKNKKWRTLFSVTDAVRLAESWYSAWIVNSVKQPVHLKRQTLLQHDFYYINMSIICHVMTNLAITFNYAEHLHTVCWQPGRHLVLKERLKTVHCCLHQSLDYRTLKWFKMISVINTNSYFLFIELNVMLNLPKSHLCRCKVQNTSRLGVQKKLWKIKWFACW